MFTGIIKNLGRIVAVKTNNKSVFVSVALPAGWKVKMGESISINGVCSTVRALTKKSFQVEYMPETLAKTTAVAWRAEQQVNLEQSLTLNDFIDGHLVQGHVDSRAQIVRIQTDGDSKVFTIKVAKELMKFVAPKGSIALDGVSLTVVDVAGDRFTVSLVSYTLENTTFGAKKAGDFINLETDMMAKYIINALTYAKEK